MMIGTAQTGLGFLAAAAVALTLVGTSEAQAQNCQIEVREMPVGTSVRVRTTAARAGYYSFSLRENVPDSEVLIDATGPYNLAQGQDRILMTFLRHQSMIRGNFMHDRNIPGRPHGHLIGYAGELRVYDRRGREICRTDEVGLFNGRGVPFANAQTSTHEPVRSPARSPRQARRPLMRF